LFSAVKVEGRRAYLHARKGDDIVLQSKKITIYELELLNFSGNEIVLRIVCSKGTYIRALARDLGLALHTGAYLTGLRRTRIGEMKVADACELYDFMDKLKQPGTN
jgi:tRNA pseudouridine55 synthase